MQMKKALFFLCLALVVNGYNIDVKIVDLCQCKELLLKGDDENDFSVTSLINNHPKENEVMRMTFYMLGHDMYIRIGEENNFNETHYMVFFNRGSQSNYGSGIAKSDPKSNSWNKLTETVTNDLTDRFYYTLLHLVVTNGNLFPCRISCLIHLFSDGMIKLYTNNNNNNLKMFLSVKVGKSFNPKHLSFSRNQYAEDSKIFFDCPDKEWKDEYDASISQGCASLMGNRVFGFFFSILLVFCF